LLIVILISMLYVPMPLSLPRIPSSFLMPLKWQK
jgi:hypothetical protein